jgi:hypothetical protein
MKKQTKEVKDRTYLLSNGRSPLTYSIANKHTPRRPLLYIDEEKQQQRALRYSRNQKSQFVDEQDEFAIIEPIVFQDGKLNVPKNNFQLQEFLAIHPDNKTNGGNVFYEFDPEKQAADLIANLDAQYEAETAIRTMDFDKLKSLAHLFLDANIDKMSSSEIKHNMLIIARDYPTDILDALDNPDTEVDIVARRAMDEGYVFIKGGKDIHYNIVDNKKKILTIKHGQAPQDALAQWLISDAGIDFYEQLRNKFSE